ncbi:MAG TPA: tyrosine-type recombinase/integrase [Solirubrobacteraceae bacterium]|nr:tyrosine-type recombinase/integrase [Solirubrobacteraceae bacterium]
MGPNQTSALGPNQTSAPREIAEYLRWRFSCRAGELLLLDPGLFSQNREAEVIVFLGAFARPARVLTRGLHERARDALRHAPGITAKPLPGGGKALVTLPKNGLKRKVVLPPQAREALLGMPRRAGSPYVFTAPCGRRFSKTSHYYYWRLLRAEAGRGHMAFYELRHFCATHLLELGVSHADVAVQLGHTDGGALVMSTYGHPSDEAARARVLAAYQRNPAWRLKAVSD